MEGFNIVMNEEVKMILQAISLQLQDSEEVFGLTKGAGTFL